MYSELAPKFDDVFNDIFLNLFLIKNLLILESELGNIDINKFNAIFGINTSYNEKIYLLEERIPQVFYLTKIIMINLSFKIVMNLKLFFGEN